MKLKLGLIIAVIIAVGIVTAPAFCQDKPAQGTAKNTVANDTATGSTAAVPGGAPHIFFPDSIFDFGEVAQKQSLTHVFKVLNTGDAPLKLIEAHAS